MAMGVKTQPPSTCVVLDTSASMNQRTSSNLSLLDAAKAAIEHMVRRFPNERQHKFLLVGSFRVGVPSRSSRVHVMPLPL
eukprot:2363247-Rhodomonas_salina.3